ncbi:MAG TPA: aminoacyl-tRNA hydrolase [Patescibacteria group bacterium]|nr:aminoacyl-tRNA hydrolase [Patescibacteria group bacterium]
MNLIVGLGNRGEKYLHNRHNVGFMMVDFIFNQIKNEKIVPSEVEGLKYDKYAQAETGIYKINNEKVILMKPMTFMNQSGDAVRSCVARYSSDLSDDVFIVHDDLDIRLGEYKIQKGKGPKLHNGIASIEKALGTSDFWRVRIGIDNRHKDVRIQGEIYVLQDFLYEEKEGLHAVFTDICNALKYPKAL